MKKGPILKFTSKDKAYTITFEDDGKTAYAYLKRDGEIVGAVWLYNHCAAPETSEWKDRKNIPFANCRGYMSEDGKIKKPIKAEDVIVDWEYEKQGPTAYIYIFENLYGVVGVNDKPGYARYAIKDSPIARVMHIE